jgi:type 2 lantibiotic biosynthesis protein LanM
MLSTIALNKLYKALSLGERFSKIISPYFFFSGLKKLRGWKKLRGFRQAPFHFKSRVAFERLSFYEFSVLLGQKKPKPKKLVDLLWLTDAVNYEFSELNLPEYLTRLPILNEYVERGVINPFLQQIIKAIEKVSKISNATDAEINICLNNELSIIEQLVRRAFILELNVSGIKGELKGDNDSQKYKDFTNRFSAFEQRLDFFQKYPVLLRTVITKLDLWAESIIEFLARLDSDRALIEKTIGVPSDAILKSITLSGDTHNNGRSVFVIEFFNEHFLVYKPRSTSIELGFQKYLKFFNTANSNLNLRYISVLDKDTYGWVEYVPFIEHLTQEESDIYHYRLGFLTAIVYSINGVDIFFENLISSGADPVIIDLETMFHTSIDKKSSKGPVDALQLFLYDSITGIGILPQPNQGASESELFDVSVMGAKKNAQAPYKVSGVENFGRSDMRITEIPGWINESKASSDNDFLYKTKVNSLFDGLEDGLKSVFKHKELLGSDGGVVDKCFINSKRRLIVRDTKVYGSLQDDEAHPDLLRDQLDREWHLDNLWTDLLDRPNLTSFIQSELRQLKNGDIPYFSGTIDSLLVTGGDGMIINLSTFVDETPLRSVKNELLGLTQSNIENQIRIASTVLGLDKKADITQPLIYPRKEAIVNAASIGNFILRRANLFDGSLWCDTCVNPVPKVKNFDPVRITPCDPFLYDGIMGIAMYYDDLHRITSDRKFYDASQSLAMSVFNEIEHNSQYSPSGFTGLSSIVYVINRSIAKENSSFIIYESKLPGLIKLIEAKTNQEERLDFLLGISGIACALLPYVKRSSSKAGLSFLRYLLIRLTAAGNSILNSKEPIEGMDYLRGFSHGITGISLSLYRLGEFFKKDEILDLASNLILHEYSLIKGGNWTDSHTYDGDQLVGWCHGSAGIALALSSMPKAITKNKLINDYSQIAVTNTLSKGVYGSKCLCHGTGGNLLCLRKYNSENDLLKKLSRQFHTDLLESGFSSMGSAQTMGIGLMTGLTGAGYYLLGANDLNFDFDFLTLS